MLKKKKRESISVLASSPPPSAHPGPVATSCSASSELRILLLALRVSARQVPAAPRRVTVAGTGHQMPVPQPLRHLAQQAPADLLGQPCPLLLTLLGQLGQQLREEAYHSTGHPALCLPPTRPPHPRPHRGLLFCQLLLDLLLASHKAFMPLLLGLLQLSVEGTGVQPRVSKGGAGLPELCGQGSEMTFIVMLQPDSKVMGTVADSWLWR